MMKRRLAGIGRNGLWAVLMLLGVLLLLTTDALAAEGADGWRPLYDIVMRWVNFAILAAIIFKFGRKPLKEFALGKSRQISDELKQLEGQKAALEEKVRQAQQDLDDSSRRLEQIKERIVQEGHKQKAAILDEARVESQLYLESTRRKINNRLLHAHNRLRSEMIDLAFNQALARLPQFVTDADNRELIDAYLRRAEAD
jgi:F-type H+-transporting ATPase subunit b